jgi:UDP-glucuronate decarboxylase
MSRRALVTGGAGFIGSHLCRKLLDEGWTVSCLDNLCTGSAGNVDGLSGPSFQLIEQSVTEPIELAAEVIFHLACPASPVQYQADPVETMRTNVIGTLEVLKAARRCQARVVLASTSEVYGDPTVEVQSEDYWGHVNPVGPRSCYNEGKRAAESLCMDFFRQYGVAVRIARIFNTYGPIMAFSDGRVVSNFIVSVLRGEPLTLYGDGSQTRSFCFVSDTVEALRRMADLPSGVTGPINIGNPAPLTIAELARRVQRTCRREAEIVHAPLPGDDPSRRCPDISLAKRLLDWAPKVALEEGLRLTVEDFARRLGLDAASFGS